MAKRRNLSFDLLGIVAYRLEILYHIPEMKKDGMNMQDYDLQYTASLRLLNVTIKAHTDIDTFFSIYRISRKQRYRYYSQGCIRINDALVKQNRPLHQSDLLQITLPLEEEGIPAWSYPLSVCYEDDCFLIVSKPPGMIVHSDGVNTSHTLHNCVQDYYNRCNLHIPVRAIHRLDQETSGLVLYCKIPFFQAYMDELLAQKKIERSYLAWVTGSLPKTQITIEKPLAKDRHNAKKMRVHPHGRYACTIVTPKKYIQGATLAECRLKTGRTHQIRVHLADLGHPILSDPLYGQKDKRISRCALHAWKLRFYHPLEDTCKEVICPLSDDMNLC